MEALAAVHLRAKSGYWGKNECAEKSSAWFERLYTGMLYES